MPHICFMNTTPFWGGGERSHLEKAVAFAKRGYQVTVIADPQGPLYAKAQAAGLSGHALALGKLSFLNPFAYIRLARFFKKAKVDAVVFNSSNDLKVGAIAARRAGIPHVVYLRGLAMPIRNTHLNRYLLGTALTRVIANSAATKRMVLDTLPIPSEKVSVVHHGIDLSAGFPSAERPGRSRLVLGNAGRLTAQKAQHELVELGRLLRERGIDFELHIAGEGEARGTLEAQITEHDLVDQITLHGFVADMPAFYQSLDAFVLSSHWEGYGFVLVEAMRNGLPVLAYDTSSNPEIVANGQTGYLVPTGDVAALADKVVLLKKDQDWRREMGRAGQRRVRQRFELERQLDLFEAAVFGQEIS